jgi:uncharacterized membrane protein
MLHFVSFAHFEALEENQMAFCKNCGTPVEGAFCPKCGTPAAAPAAGGVTPPPPAPQSYAQAPMAAAPVAAGASDNLMGALAYLFGFITGILFLVIAPYNQSKFVRFHAFQSIFLSIAWVAVFIALNILSAILTSILGILGLLMGLVGMVVGLGFFILWIMLMVKAYQNQRWELPIIGALAAKQA